MTIAFGLPQLSDAGIITAAGSGVNTYFAQRFTSSAPITVSGIALTASWNFAATIC